MKMVVRSQTFPVAIFVVGAAAFIASNLDTTVRNQEYQIVLGGLLMALGFLLWAIPELDKWMKRKQRQRDRIERMAMKETRRSAPPQRR
jgi:hypothetical protein